MGSVEAARRVGIMAAIKPETTGNHKQRVLAWLPCRFLPFH